MPSVTSALTVFPDTVLLCDAPLHVEAVAIAVPAELPRICAKCKQRKPAAQFAPCRNLITLEGHPCRAKLCDACARVAFEAGLKPGSRVYLRHAYEQNGSGLYAPPGAIVKILDVCSTGGPPLYCEIRARQTRNGIERPAKARVMLAAAQLCKTRGEATNA